MWVKKSYIDKINDVLAVLAEGRIPDTPTALDEITPGKCASLTETVNKLEQSLAQWLQTLTLFTSGDSSIEELIQQSTEDLFYATFQNMNGRYQKLMDTMDSVASGDRHENLSVEDFDKLGDSVNNMLSSLKKDWQIVTEILQAVEEKRFDRKLSENRENSPTIHSLNRILTCIKSHDSLLNERLTTTQGDLEKRKQELEEQRVGHQKAIDELSETSRKEREELVKSNRTEREELIESSRTEREELVKSNRTEREGLVDANRKERDELIENNRKEIEAIIETGKNEKTELIETNRKEKESLLETARKESEQKQKDLERISETFRDALTKKQKEIENMTEQQTELLDYNYKTSQEVIKLTKTVKEVTDKYQDAVYQNKILQNKIASLEAAKKELANKKANLTREKNLLEEKQDMLSLAFQNNSELVAEISKEVDESLNTIPGTIQSITANLSRSTEIEKIEEVANTCQKTRTAVEQLRLYSEKKGRFERLSLGEETLEKLLQEMQSEVQLHFIERNIPFHIDREKTLPQMIFTDRMRVLLILKNLILRSLKVAHAKQVTCKVYNVSHTQLGNQNTKAKTFIAFEISDTGMENAFVSIPTAMEIERELGYSEEFLLGLPILRKLSAPMEGEIHTRSMQNKGNVSILYIPVMTPEFSEEDLVEESEESADSDKDEFLVIHEEPAQTKKLEQFLGKYGVARHVTSIKAGMALLEKHRFTGAFCMGGSLSDSPENIKNAVRQMIEQYNIPTCILSASESQQQLVPGVLETLSLPVRDEQLPNMMKLIGQYDKANLRFVGLIHDKECESNDRLITEIQKTTAHIHSISLENLSNLKSLQRLDMIILNHGKQTELPKVVKKVRGHFPKIPIIALVGDEVSMVQRLDYDALVDFIMEKKALSGGILRELITLLTVATSESKGKKSYSARISNFLRNRESLLKEKELILLTDDASATFKLRKVLQEEGAESKILDYKNLSGVMHEASGCDLILIDGSLDRNKALKTISHIRENKHLKTLPLVVMNGKQPEMERDFFIHRGATEYLNNTADLSELTGLLKTLLADAR